jgi:hypothetical protein
MLSTFKHVLLLEQQRVSPKLVVLIIECQCSSKKLVQLLSKRDTTVLGFDVKRLIRELKCSIKNLRRIENKASVRNANMHVASLDDVLVTEANSNRVKRWER